MGAGLLAVKSGFILFIKNYQFPIQINTLEREIGLDNHSTVRNNLYGCVTSWNGSRVVSR
jgi:hypothetical protein